MAVNFDDLNGLRSEQEKDEAHAVAWVKSAKPEDVLRVWLAIQRLGGTPERELISRFAQLGCSHAVLLAAKTPPEVTP